VLITYFDVIDKINDLEPLFQSIDKVWVTDYKQTQSIMPDLTQKRDNIYSGTVKGIIGYVDDVPSSLALFDVPNGYYGSLLLFTIDPNIRVDLIREIVSRQLNKGIVLELIQFIDGFDFRDAFLDFGFQEKERQRMLYKIENPPEFDARPEVIFDALSEDTAATVGLISHNAHEIRKNIEGYRDFSSPELRANMAKRMRQGHYGTPVDNASVLMHFKGEPAGICDVVEIECWGYKRIAWIMDVAILPDFQGYGLGKHLIQKVISEVAQAGIPAVGLGVTLSNERAS